MWVITRPLQITNLAKFESLEVKQTHSGEFEIVGKVGPIHATVAKFMDGVKAEDCLKTWMNRLNRVR